VPQGRLMTADGNIYADLGNGDRKADMNWISVTAPGICNGVSPQA